MNTTFADAVFSLQRFEPAPDDLYTIDAAAHLAHATRRLVLVCCKHGLVAPVIDEQGGYYFDETAIRTLQRVSHLRTAYGVNIAGVVKIMELMDELERLRQELRDLRG